MTKWPIWANNERRQGVFRLSRCLVLILRCNTINTIYLTKWIRQVKYVFHWHIVEFVFKRRGWHVYTVLIIICIFTVDILFTLQTLTIILLRWIVKPQNALRGVAMRLKRQSEWKSNTQFRNVYMVNARRKAAREKFNQTQKLLLYVTREVHWFLCVWKECCKQYTVNDFCF